MQLLDGDVQMQAARDNSLQKDVRGGGEAGSYDQILPRLLRPQLAVEHRPHAHQF